MLGALIAGALVEGAGFLLSSLLGEEREQDTSFAIVHDVPAKLTHWQYFQKRWGCVITVSQLPEWFISRYQHREVVVTGLLFDADSHHSIASRDAANGRDAAVIEPLLYMVKRNTEYALFIPYPVFETDAIRRIVCKMIFFMDGQRVLQIAPSFTWAMPKPYRVNTVQHVYLACYAKIMTALFDVENEGWASDYEGLVRAICEDAYGVEDETVRAYLETCFVDGVPADYEIEAALNRNAYQLREEIFTDLFEFYTVMQQEIETIIPKSDVIAHVAHSVGITADSYYAITGFKRKNKKTAGGTAEFLNTDQNPDIAAFLEILEIQPPLSIQKVKTAYRIKCKEFHPDQYQNLNKKIQDFAASELIKAQEARDALMQYLEKR